MRSIEEALNTFQKKMWSSTKPIDFCLVFIEDLLREQMRIQTVMRESKNTINSMLEGEEQQEDRLNYLLSGLSGQTPAVFLDHLTEEQRHEYNQYLKKQVTFEDLEG